MSNDTENLMKMQYHIIALDVLSDIELVIITVLSLLLLILFISIEKKEKEIKKVRRKGKTLFYLSFIITLIHCHQRKE